MERKQIVDRLADLAEKAETAHRVYRDQEAGLDAQALREAVRAINTEAEPEQGDTCEKKATISVFDTDVKLLHELKLMSDQYQRSAEASPLAVAFLGSMVPGGRVMASEAMQKTKHQAVILRQVYERLGDLLGGVR